MKSQGENVWIIKPGENSNRGYGICLTKSIGEIAKIINCKKHTHILQKYIEHPLLYNKRKFDIRCYGLLTAINGYVKGYFYEDGYLRTSSKDFSLKSITSKSIHLTNEAIQMKYEEFGRFEAGNKLTYPEFQKYLDAIFPDLNVNFSLDILSQIKTILTDTFRATHNKLDPQGRQYTFEIFGYDFMIDADFHVYLIEANINPCLEIMSPVTARLVPLMIDNSLRLALDPIFQAPIDSSITKKTVGDILPELKYELVYDSKIDNQQLQKLTKVTQNLIMEVCDEEYEYSDDPID